MPTADQVLLELTEIANSWPFLAIFWHAYFLALIAPSVLGLRLPARVYGLLLSVPLVSVSALAWLAENPFNGTAFAIMGVALAGVSIISLKGIPSVSFDWVAAAVLGFAGLFYGVYGAIRLDVTLDWVLFAGGLMLILSRFGNGRSGRRHAKSV